MYAWHFVFCQVSATVVLLALKPVRAGCRVDTQNVFVPPIGSESVLTCIPIFASFVGWLVNTQIVAWHKMTCIHAFTCTPRRQLDHGQQSAQQTMNGFTLVVHFCLIPLSKTCSFEWICKDGFIFIESRPFDLSTRYRLFDLSTVDVYAVASSLPTD